MKVKLGALAGNVHSGEEVYVLNLPLMVPLMNFIYCGTKDKGLLKEGNFSGLEILVYYADFYSKKITEQAPLKLLSKKQTNLNCICIT